MVRVLWFIHQKKNASNVSSADWQHQTHLKNLDIFSHVLLQLFSGLEILV